MFTYQKKVNLEPGIAKEKNTSWKALYVFIKYDKEYVKVERIQPSQNNQNIAKTKKKHPLTIKFSTILKECRV